MGSFDDKQDKKPFQLCPEGFHPARLYSIVDLGTHDNAKQDGTVGLKHEIRLTWEIPGELMADGRPFAVSKNYTLSRSKKGTLYIHKKSGTFQMVKKWLGHKEEKDTMFFPIKDLIGKDCELEIVHAPSKDGTKTYVNIDQVSKLRKGQECLPAVNKPFVYHCAMGTACPEFEALPDWAKKVIEDSYEIAGGLEKRQAVISAEAAKAQAESPNAPAESFDDVPF